MPVRSRSFRSQPGDALPGVARQMAQLVQLLGEALADHSPLAQRGRRLVSEGRGDELHNVIAGMQVAKLSGESIPAFGGFQKIQHLRRRLQPSPKSGYVSWIRAPAGDAVHQTLQVGHGRQRVQDLLPPDAVAVEERHAVKATIQGLDIQKRLAQPSP